MVVIAVKSRTWVIGLVLISICAMVIIDGCVGDDKNQLPRGQYLAIEEHLEVSSTMINGTYSFPFHAPNPMSFVSIEWFREVNSPSGVVYNSYQPYYFPTVNDSLMILWGKSSHVISPPTQDHLDLTITGIYGLPYTGESGFTVERIDSNGTLVGSYGNKTVEIKSGEQWSSATVSETISVNDSYNVTNWMTGTPVDEVRPYAYAYYQSSTWTVKNLGMYDKANLTQHLKGS